LGRPRGQGWGAAPSRGGPEHGLRNDWKGGRQIRNSLIGLAVWLGASLAAGWVGSRYMPGEWYATLAKPAWNPPSAVFGPVWTALYVLMGVSAWLVWRQVGFSGARGPLSLFITQLVLNGLWSYLFFGRHMPGVAFVEIVVLWFFIAATLVAFWKIRPMAGALLIPYGCWVGFASALNFQLWRLNL
jgi:benzodiazapine receptor